MELKFNFFRPLRRSKPLRASWLSERANSEEKAILLYAGRISWEKNLRLRNAAYASSDIFAFPSTTETFGQVVLEAMQNLLDGYQEVIAGIQPLAAA